MIDLRIDIDTKNLDRWKIFTEDEKKSVLRDLAGEYMRMMRERVRKGVKVSGGNFKRYSRSYEERKRRADRMKDGHWLRLTGELMRSMVVKVSRTGSVLRACITFEGTRPQPKFRGTKRGGRLTVTQAGGEMVSNALIAAENHRLRPFVGMNKREVNELVKTMSGLISKMMRKRKGA